MWRDSPKKREMRLAVAKDVLKRLRRKKLNVFSGNGYIVPKNTSYFEIDNLKSSCQHDNSQEHLDKIESSCEVCALGACMLSHIRLFNKVVIEDTFGGENAKFALGSYFSRQQLGIIENVFERISNWSTREENSKRLAKIMRNIIKNNGKYVYEESIMSRLHTDCEKSPTGKHEPDWLSVAIPQEATSGDPFLQGVIDVNCKHCGLSGSGRVEPDDLNWE